MSKSEILFDTVYIHLSNDPMREALKEVKDILKYLSKGYKIISAIPSNPSGTNYILSKKL